jgi:hypothetical protein
MSDDPARLSATAARFRGWRFDQALPFWAREDRDVPGLGFHETLRLDGVSADSPFERMRVQACQLYSYAHDQWCACVPAAPRPVGTSVPQRTMAPVGTRLRSACSRNVTIGGIATAAAIFKVRRLLLRDAVERHVVHCGAQIQVIVARPVNAKDRILHVTVGGP